MTDSNVIWGTDFQGLSAADRLDAKLDLLGRELKDCIAILDAKGWHADTAPSEYCADDGDCA